MKRRDTGIRGEKLARDFLKKRGYRILETNYRCPEGEIDIITKHKDSLVFIEVRTKKSQQPQWAIAPGQAIVFYQGDTVLGGGVIEAPEPPLPSQEE